VSTREVVELRLEGTVVAAPAGDEQQLRVTAAGALVVEAQSGNVRVRHGPAIVSPGGQKIQLTG
jgi:hypothetical protein